MTREVLALAALVLLAPLLFLGAAISIDAPVFVAVARQIALHPLDPFGFDMIWDPTSPFVAEFNHNPPLVSYVLAPVVATLGEWEPALHAVLLPFPLIAAFAFLGIARRLGGGGADAAAILVATPAFLLLSTTLMLDVPVLAGMLAALYALLRSNERPSAGSAGWETLAGVAAAAAGLTKYVGFSIAPLLGAALFLLPVAGVSSTRRTVMRWLRVLGIPLAVWAAWGAYTYARYGAIHYAGGVSLVGQRDLDPADVWNHTLSVPVYYGAALLFPVFVFVQRLFGARRGTELAVAGILMGAAVVTWVLPDGAPARRVDLAVPEAVFAATGFAGAVVVWGLAIWRDRAVWATPEQRFLAVWLGGVLVFSVAVNWHVNAADALIAAPPALLLLFRDPATRPSRRAVGIWLALLLPFSLCLTTSDVRQRNVYRDLASRAGREIGSAPGERWLVGHWGFQYYFERESFRPVVPPQYEHVYGRSDLAVGDWVASARNVSQLDVTRNLARYGMKVVWRWDVQPRLPLRATNPDAGAGFYSHQSGHGPFAWGWEPVEEIGLARITSVR